MKILQLNPSFYPAFGYGGTVRVAYELSRGLVQRGHYVTVFTTDVYEKNKRLKYNNPSIVDGIKIYRFRNISNWLAWRRYHTPLSLIPTAKQKVKEFDVIHIHVFRSFINIPVCHYAKKYGIPYVLQAHGSLPRIIQKQRLKRLYDWVWGDGILKDASKVIALTKTEAEQYKKMGVEEDKIEIVPNGIDLSEYENLPKKGEFRRKYSIRENERIVLYLGRIYKIKGIDLLVKAFSDLIKELDDVRLVIVGPDDGFLSILKKQIENLKISDKVLFTGPLYERDKLEAYIDADVYVLPSVYEIFGITVLEACACGTPVIVTDQCGVADFVDKVGYVVKYDKKQLRDAISKVLSDEGLRRRLGEEGRKLVAGGEFGWGKVVLNIERIYLSLIQR